MPVSASTCTLAGGVPIGPRSVSSAYRRGKVVQLADPADWADEDIGDPGFGPCLSPLPSPVVLRRPPARRQKRLDLPHLVAGGERAAAD
jgi:hypothetical protein